MIPLLRRHLYLSPIVAQIISLTPTYSLPVPQVEFSWAWLESLLRLKSPCWPLCSSLELRILFHSYSCYWQNSVPCSCRTDVPDSLLVVNLGLSQLLEATCIPLHIDSASSGEHSVSYCLMLQIPLAPFCSQPEKTLCFKELMWLDYAHLDNLYIWN